MYTPNSFCSSVGKANYQQLNCHLLRAYSVLLIRRCNDFSPVPEQISELLYTGDMVLGVVREDMIVETKATLTEIRARVKNVLIHSSHPRRRNGTTLIVGLNNGHIRKNLTQKWWSPEIWLGNEKKKKKKKHSSLENATLCSLPLTQVANFISSSSSAFPSYISGVHHFWVRFLRMWPFFLIQPLR